MDTVTDSGPGLSISSRSEVAKVLRVTGLHRQLDIFPAVQAAITSPGRGQRQPDGTADA